MRALVSVRQQADVGLGGYLLFSATLFLGVHQLLAILLAVPVAAMVFRLRRAYFAIGTWVVAEVFRLLAAQMTVPGGGSGISLPTQMTGLLGRKAMREVSIFWVELALTAIRNSGIASSSLGIRIAWVKYAVYIFIAAMTAMIGALVNLQKLRVSPDAARCLNDWTALVIFIMDLGGIDTIVYFLLREFLSDFGSIYLMLLGALEIVILLVDPKGIWGYVADRFGWPIFLIGYRITSKDDGY